MIDRLRDMATLSVARGCGFASLAVFCMMIGFAADFAMMLKVGGVAALIVALALIVKALRAGHIDHRTTEMWILLEPAERPQEPYAQRLVASIMRETFYRFAFMFAIAAAFMLSLAGAISLVRLMAA